MVDLAVIPKLNPEVYFVDVSKKFVMKVKQKYEDKEEMINLARCKAIEAGFTLIIDKSYSGSRRKKLKLVIEVASMKEQRSLNKKAHVQ